MSTSSDAGDSERVAERFRCRRHDVGGGVVRVSVAGELDRVSAAALDQLLRSAVSNGAATVIDLDDLRFIDIAGARTLRAAAARARQHGCRLIAVNGAPDVEKWLCLMGLDRQLKLVSRRTSQIGAARTAVAADPVTGSHAT